MRTPTRKPRPIYDRAEVLKAVRLIVGAEAVTELRALDAVTQQDKWPHIESGYFDDPDELVKAVGAIKSAKGIYIVPNPIDHALLARAHNRTRKARRGESTQDTNILRRRWLLIDADAQRPSGISASDEEHKSAIERTRSVYRYLKAPGWPDPIAADSGNGGHLMYCIDLPAEDEALVKLCLAALARRFDDDVVKIDKSVFNPARIWKLYGTLACKGDDTPDRPHRIARILSHPKKLQAVPRHLLETLAAEAGEDRACVPTPHHEGNGQAFDVAAFIVRHHLNVSGPEDWNGEQGPGRRWVFNKSPMCEHHDGAAFIVQHAGGAFTAGCHHDSCSWNGSDLRQRFELSIDKANVARVAPVLIRVSDVQAEDVKWLWRNRIPMGKLTLLAGDPGLGKSFLTLDVAARVTRGASWPDDAAAAAPRGSVVLLSAEDDIADTIRPRLESADADVSSVHVLEAIAGHDEEGKFRRGVNLGRDLDHVKSAIERVDACRLLVIDPISAYLGGTDSHRNAEIRELLAPLADLARHHLVAVLAVTHLRKSEGPAIHRSIGSLAFVAGARAVWAVAPDAEDVTRKLFLPLKNNLAPLTHGLAYRIESREFGARIEWELDPVDTSADEALGWGSRNKHGSAVNEAVDWLLHALAYGPVPGKEVKKRAADDGIALRTLDRAKATLGVISAPNGFRGPWVWRLPDSRHSVPESPESANRETLAHSGKTGALFGDQDDWGEL